MVRRLSQALVVACLVCHAGAAELVAQDLGDAERARLDDWYRRTADRTAGGQWGIAIGTMDGRVLWSVSPELELIPASTTKVFTTGFSRTTMGGEGAHHHPRDRRRLSRAGDGPLAGDVGAGAGRRPDPGALRPRRSHPARAGQAAQGAWDRHAVRSARHHQPDRSGRLVLSLDLVVRLRRTALRPAGRPGHAAREYHLAHLPAGPGRRLAPATGQCLPRRRRAHGPDRCDHRGREPKPAFAPTRSRWRMDAGWLDRDRAANRGALGGSSRPVAAAGRGLGLGAGAGRHSLDQRRRSRDPRAAACRGVGSGGVGAARQRGDGDQPAEPEYRCRAAAAVGGGKPECRAGAAHRARSAGRGADGAGAPGGRQRAERGEPDEPAHPDALPGPAAAAARAPALPPAAPGQRDRDAPAASLRHEPGRGARQDRDARRRRRRSPAISAGRTGCW